MTRTAEGTSALSADQRTQLREGLDADRRATELLVSRLASDIASFQGSRQDTSVDDEHDPEGPTLAFEQSQSAAILGDTRQHLAQIDDALVRIDSGAYGVCVTCGSAIPFARLEVRPYSTQCVSCASKARS
jgi:DnaK suppressor protein